MPTASQTAYTAAAVLRIRNNLSQAMGAQANVRDFLIHDSLTECFNLTYNDVAIEARTTPAAVSSFVNRRKAAYQKSKFEAGIAELIARRCGLKMGPRLLA